jgi:GxxExxY protein
MQLKNYERIPQKVEDVGRAVLDAAFRVHTALGPGLLESVYQTCTAYELTQSGLLAPTELALPVIYKEVKLDAGFGLICW